MAVSIIWSPRADHNFNEMVDDLLDRWSEKVAMKFVQDTFAKIEHIANFPEIYPESRDIPGVRRCVVNPNVSLYYQIISDNEIELIAFYSNRINPRSIEL